MKKSSKEFSEICISNIICIAETLREKLEQNDEKGINNCLGAIKAQVRIFKMEREQ